MPGPAEFARDVVSPRLFATGAGSYPLPMNVAVVFGEKPDLAVHSHELCDGYASIDSDEPR